MQFACPHCRKQLSVGSEHAGMQMRCPNCRVRFEVPTIVTGVTATPPLPARDAVTVNPPQLSNCENERPDIDSIEPVASGEDGTTTIVYTGACARLLALGGVGIILILASHIYQLTSVARIRWDLLLIELPITLPFVILNLLAARNLREFGSKALVIAGCTSSLFAGAVLILALVMAFRSLMTAVRTVSPALPLTFISFVVIGFAAFFLIFGSIRALLCLNHPDVQARMK